MTARRIVPLAVFVLMLGLLGAGLRSGPRDLPSPLIGQPAPPLQLASLDSAPTSSVPDALRGQVWVLNVWASWCAPCRAEAPVLETVWRQVEGEGVQFVGLDTRDTEAAALAFLDAYDVTYPNVIDADGRLQLLFSDTLPPQAIPSTLVVDREGRVAGRIIGRVTEATLTALIEDVAKS